MSSSHSLTRDFSGLPLSRDKSRGIEVRERNRSYVFIISLNSLQSERTTQSRTEMTTSFETNHSTRPLMKMVHAIITVITCHVFLPFIICSTLIVLDGIPFKLFRNQIFIFKVTHLTPKEHRLFPQKRRIIAHYSTHQPVLVVSIWMTS